MDDIIDISESWDGPKKSNNFGDGIELLMNDRKSSSSGGGQSSDINIEDLNFLEDELNNLSDAPTNTYSAKSDFFGSSSSNKNDDSSSHNVKFSLGSDTASSSANKTWDGYDKFNDIPVDPSAAPPSGTQMTK